MRSRAEKLAYTGLLTALALIFSYLESFLPPPLPLPGFKLGLGNLVVLFAAYFLSLPHAALISLLRVLVTGLLFGSPTGFFFSLSGAAFAFLTLIFSKKILGKRVTFIGVSALSAAAFNTGQLLAASLLYQSLSLLGYLAALLAASAILGALTGCLLNLSAGRLARLFSVGLPFLSKGGEPSSKEP